MITPTRTGARLYALLLAAVLAALAAVPAWRELAALIGGLRFTDYFPPSLLAIAIAASGVQAMPMTQDLSRTGHPAPAVDGRDDGRRTDVDGHDS